MGKKSELTKNKIIVTARALFIEKGFDGLRMQELANRAGVNKGLLHHYFNSKTNLFESIFSDAIKEMFSGIVAIMESDEPSQQKFEIVVDRYFDLLLNNPQLPVFVLFELQRNPLTLLKVFEPQQVIGVIRAMSANGDRIDQTQAMHLVISIVSLCVFPFMARPIINQIMPEDKDFENFIEERRPLVKTIIANLLKTL
jgi:AcrR family transcriptional regulator